MKVVVPYRPGMLFRRTYDAAKAWPGGCEFVEIRNDDEPASPEKYNPTYPELLADLWERGEAVVMLEHDVVPHADSIYEIAFCPEAWCGYGYVDGGCFNISGVNLGCTKLSTDLMWATREWAQEERNARKGWLQCDTRLCLDAVSHGLKPHRHYPNVEHRGTRHHVDEPHRLGSDYVQLGVDGEPTEKKEPYKPLTAPRIPGVPRSSPLHEDRPLTGFLDALFMEDDLDFYLRTIGRIQTARMPQRAPGPRGQGARQVLGQSRRYL